MAYLLTIASNSNVVKVDFEYTSTVVAKLVIKIDFPRIPLIVSLRFLLIRSPLAELTIFFQICSPLYFFPVPITSIWGRQTDSFIVHPRR